MLEVRFLHSSATVLPTTFNAVIEGVSGETGWSGAVLRSREAFISALGFDSVPIGESEEETHSGYPPSSVEIFTVGNNMLLVLSSPGDALRRSAMLSRRIGSQRMSSLLYYIEDVRGLIIGVVGANSDEALALLGELRRSFDSVMSQMEVANEIGNWADLVLGERKEVFGAKLEEEGVAVKFKKAELDETAINQADVMDDRTARALMVEISEAGFARESDLLSKRGKEVDDYKATLEAIKNAGLVDSEYLLQCRKNSAQLARVANKGSVAELNDSSIRCASCGRKFSEELLKEAYSLSDAGKKMLQGSHWMTVWVSRSLVEIGVPLESIFWNYEEAGEEVDIVVEFGGSLWLFELKDREFGAGDAHPFNYRRVRYGANRMVVVTTDKVSVDARRVFKDLTPNHLPIFVEGLSNLRGELKKALDADALKKAVEAVNLASLVSGYNLDGFLKILK